MKRILDGKYIRWRNYQNCGNRSKEAEALYLKITSYVLIESRYANLGDLERQRLIVSLLSLFNIQFIQIEPTKKAFNEIIAPMTLSEIRNHLSELKSFIKRSKYAFGFEVEYLSDLLAHIRLYNQGSEAIDWSWIDHCHTGLKQPIKPFIHELTKTLPEGVFNIFPVLSDETISMIEFNRFKSSSSFHVSANLLKSVIQLLEKHEAAPDSFTYSKLLSKVSK